MNPEKIEEMRQEMIEEVRLRKDFDYCLETSMDMFNLTDDELRNLSSVISRVNLYGWNIDCRDLMSIV